MTHPWTGNKDFGRFLLLVFASVLAGGTGCIFDYHMAESSDSFVSPVCGNWVLEPGETCDGTDFGGADCDSMTSGAAPAGQLSCIEECQTIDTSGCTEGDCEEHWDCAVGAQCINFACVEVGDTCDSGPPEITAPFTSFVGHSTENLSDSYRGGLAGLDCTSVFTVKEPTEGLDRTYAVPMEAGDYLTVWVLPHGFDVMVYLVDACPPQTGDCIQGSDRGGVGSAERMDFIAAENGTYYVVVDAYDTGFGTYDITFTRGENAAALENPGDLIFSELTPYPVGGDYGNNCEWLEVYNPTSQALNLDGVTFTSPAGNLDLDGTLVVGSGDYAVIARLNELADNCNVNWISDTYRGSDFNLESLRSETSCTISIVAGGITIDEVTYTDSWPVVEGYSLYLCTNHASAADNDDGANWQQTPQESEYAVTDGTYTNYGTPGPDYTNPGTCN